MKTLITCIGRGNLEEQARRGDDDNKRTFPGYELLTYELPNQSSVKASFASEAIVSSQAFGKIDKVVIWGTVTSSWGALLREDSDEDLEIQFKLFEMKYFDEESPVAGELRELLKLRWQVKEVELCVHETDLAPEKAKDMFFRYANVLLRHQDEEIILDVTHGFRWMPMFLNAALQFQDALAPLKRPVILYGEMQGKRGVIRDLSYLWQGNDIAQAIRQFQENFDAEELCGCLVKDFPRLAGALKNYATSLQGNFILPIVWEKESPADKKPGQKLRALQNALQEVRPLLETAPGWLASLVKKLQKFVARLSNEPQIARRILMIAELYASHGKYGQAIMALEIAMGIHACETCSPGAYPDWTLLHGNLVRLLAGELPIGKASLSTLRELENARNMIAHGAMNSTQGRDSTPDSINLKKQFQRFRSAISDLLNSSK